ncbi:MAG: hypothetical protein P8I93_02890 [Crocinitomicaceae bacterium]|nr:hypothetical protein [Crocinitomicaceae bacterium]
MIEASLVGVIKTVLIILGFFVILKFVGKILILKRNLAEEESFVKEKKNQEAKKKYINKNLGKTTILKSTKSKDVQDVEHEELS